MSRHHADGAGASSIRYRLLALAATVTVAACAHDPAPSAARDRAYEDHARLHEAVAADHEIYGNDSMAAHHRREAATERHNRVANGCGVMGFLIDVFVETDFCQKKHPF